MIIHKYKLCGQNFVLDTNSGAVHIVDDVSYDILEHVKSAFFDHSKGYVIKKLENKYSKAEIEEAFEELLGLYNSEKLFSEDSYAHLANEDKIKSPIKAICLNVAHACNLRCGYCFVSRGDFGCKKELMSLETAKNAIDFLIKNSGKIKNLEVDFFGGEPLMNFGVVKETTAYARSLEEKFGKKFRFTITTNGLMLTDEIIDFINKEMYDVVLSLDGRLETHDRFRKTKTGFGSYNLVLPKFKKLVDSRGEKKYYIRATFTKHNLDFTKDVEHIYNLGFKNIAVEPVMGKDLDYAIDENCIDDIEKEFEKLAEILIKHKKNGSNINFFNFDIGVNNGPCIIKRLKGCGAGNDYVAVTPNGNIYSCHQLVDEEKFKMGNVNKGDFDESLKDKLLKTTVYHKEKCKICWAKFYCCGGCSAKNHEFNGDIIIPTDVACKLQKKKIECAIALQA